MFQVQISLKPESLFGLEALDARRRLRLPDGTTINLVHIAYRTADCSEALARVYFSATLTLDSVIIPLSWCTPEDVEEETYPYVGLRKDLAPARIVDLYLARKYQTLVERLEVYRQEVLTEKGILHDSLA